MTNRVWILGASDPEMERIERLLSVCSERVVYALHTGARVRPDSAYQADGLSAPIPPDATVYRVECDGPAIPAGATVIDHHRPGDPGYGRPPAEFLPASSVGQVFGALARLDALAAHRHTPVAAGGTVGDIRYEGSDRGWSVVVEHPTEDDDDPAGLWWAFVPDEIVMTAAADHCLAAAYRGDCPGVDPDALMTWRAETRAAFQGRPVSELLADIERARQAIRAAPTIELSPPYEARDLRGQRVAELPEAAAREGVCFMSDLPDRGGRIKVVCQSGTPEQIRAFMQQWAPAQGLTGIYGDPERGFAGGYLTA